MSFFYPLEIYSLLGMGKMWDAQQNRFDDAAKVLTKNGIEPISLGAKEGRQAR